MGNWKTENLPNRPATLYVVYQVVDPDLELKGGPGFDLLTPLAFLPSVRFFIFLTPKKEGRSPRAPPLDPPLVSSSIHVSFPSIRAIFVPGSSIPPNTTDSSTLILFTLGSLDQKKRSIHFLLDESDLMLGHKESIEGVVIASTRSPSLLVH